MTSSDGMMIMMIRHVYVRLRFAGPEDPPHATIMCQRLMADRVKLDDVFKLLQCAITKIILKRLPLQVLQPSLQP